MNQRSLSFPSVAALVLSGSLIGLASCCKTTQPSVSTTAPVEASSPPVKADANDELQSIISKIYSTGAFSVKAETSYEEISATGERKRTEPTVVRYVVQQPNKMRADIKGPGRNREYWYDGSTFTAVDKEKKMVVQAKLDVPLSELRQVMIERFGISLPLSRLIAPEALAEVKRRIVSSKIDSNQVQSGLPCKQLSFEEEFVSWSVCVSPDAGGLPHYVAITYKSEPGQPQLIANIRSWNLNPILTEGSFTAPKLP